MSMSDVDSFSRPRKPPWSHWALRLRRHRLSNAIEKIKVPTSSFGITRPDHLNLIHCSIDDLTIPSKTGKGVLRRVPEVFDCWFESGSMPYAQAHYPFENRKEFEDGFPGDFIAEGIDQTRGW